MTELSQWDFVQTFSGYEAASLILGLDPALENSGKTAPVIKTMKESYKSSLNSFKDEYLLKKYYLTESEQFRNFGKEQKIIRQMINKAADSVFKPMNLMSFRMYGAFTELESETIYKNELYEMADERFYRWCFDEILTSFDHQLFETKELCRWLEVRGFKSIYEFKLNENSKESNPKESKRNQHLMLKRRDLLKPVIELAQSQCRNHWDVAEVWAKLRTLANAKHSPLMGMDEDGIQYIDEKDSLGNLNMKALRMRLYRSRQ